MADTHRFGNRTTLLPYHVFQHRLAAVYTSHQVCPYDVLNYARVRCHEKRVVRYASRVDEYIDIFLLHTFFCISPPRINTMRVSVLNSLPASEYRPRTQQRLYHLQSPCGTRILRFSARLRASLRRGRRERRMHRLLRRPGRCPDQFHGSRRSRVHVCRRGPRL